MLKDTYKMWIIATVLFLVVATSVLAYNSDIEKGIVVERSLCTVERERGDPGQGETTRILNLTIEKMDGSRIKITITEPHAFEGSINAGFWDLQIGDSVYLFDSLFIGDDYVVADKYMLLSLRAGEPFWASIIVVGVYIGVTKSIIKIKLKVKT